MRSLAPDLKLVSPHKQFCLGDHCIQLEGKVFFSPLILFTFFCKDARTDGLVGIVPGLTQELFRLLVNAKFANELSVVFQNNCELLARPIAAPDDFDTARLFIHRRDQVDAKLALSRIAHHPIVQDPCVGVFI